MKRITNFDIILAAAHSANLERMAHKLRIPTSEAIRRIYQLRMRGIAIRFPLKYQRKVTP